MIACPGCDLLQRIPPLPPGGRARCVRCGEQLASRPSGSLERPFALTLAAAIALIIANTQPLLDLSAVGRHASTTIIGGAYEMWVHGHEVTGALVAFCAVVAPSAYIVFLLSILIRLRSQSRTQWVGPFLRWANLVRPWSMLEVMLLGILIALIKIAELATVVAGIGLFAVGALVVLFSAIPASLDSREVWNRVRWVNDDAPSRVEAGP